MITIYIDNVPRRVEPDQNLLQACLSLGYNLPYFCWHPALHAVGACRQCAVKQFKDEHDTRGRIVMSCMTPVAEGLRISVDDPEARAFRSGVIEWLMLNHPHDCPVCDEGGECHLQDMTVMTGHARRRTRFPKRTHRNQDLGPFLNHEMNRCIACYRCVRFYRDYAGGRDLNVFSCHHHVYFGRHEDGPLESEFSGNLVEVCPTGVFTDKTLKRHYTRKWDLQTAPSICAHCGVGCNTIAGERYGSLRRILNRYHHDVNGCFLCDRGRFGYEFVNDEKRIRSPLAHSLPLSGRDALERIAAVLAGSGGVIGIGSPRASLESNFALRSLVGPENFYSGLADAEHRIVSLIIEVLRNSPARTPSLEEVRNADAVLVLGEDVSNTAPLLALSIRQSVRSREIARAAQIKIPAWNDAGVRNAGQGERSPLFIAASSGTRLDDIATKVLRAAPDDIARLGFAVARELDPAAPGADGAGGDLLASARDIAAALKAAERPMVVTGAGCLHEGVVRAAANVARALCSLGKPAGLSCVVHESNTLGLGLLEGKTLDEARGRMREGRADTVVVLENDLYRRMEAAEADAFLGAAGSVIVLDHSATPTVAAAHIVLPAGTFAESTGTVVSGEGRAQRFYQVFVPRDDIRAGWKWIDAIMETLRRPAVTGGLPGPEAVLDALIEAFPFFAPARDVAPPAGFTIAGRKIPRQPHRYSGRTSLQANVNVSEPKPPDDPDTPLAFSMEGYEGRPPAALIPRYWSPGWNSVQSLNKFQQEVGGPLRGGDPGRRLIEPGNGGSPPYFTAPTAVRPPGEEEFLIVPLYAVFGSDELSSRAPGIAGRAPSPTLALSGEDAKRLGVAEGTVVKAAIGSQVLVLPASVRTDLPEGVAGVTAGLPGQAYISLPASGRIGIGE